MDESLNTAEDDLINSNTCEMRKLLNEEEKLIKLEIDHKYGSDTYIKTEKELEELQSKMEELDIAITESIRKRTDRIYDFFSGMSEKDIESFLN